jgi:hypothetical protein
VSDYFKEVEKIAKYRKKYSRGNNFSYKFIILDESRDQYDPKGLFNSGTTYWDEMVERWNVSGLDMVRLVEKKKIKHMWQDPNNKKIYEGFIEFKDREPTEAQWNQKMREVKKSEKITLLVVVLIVLGFIALYQSI